MILVIISNICTRRPTNYGKATIIIEENPGTNPIMYSFTSASISCLLLYSQWLARNNRLLIFVISMIKSASLKTWVGTHRGICEELSMEDSGTAEMILRGISWTAFLVEVAGHNLKSFEAPIFAWLSTLVNILFMNRLEFPCFPVYFV